MPVPFAVAIHGGAGLIRPASLTAERQAAAMASLDRIVGLAAGALADGARAVEAVVAAVVDLEEDPLFNAGRGAVLGGDGRAELDAAVMDGIDRRAGAVTGVRTVRNPIRLAQAVMQRTPHVILAGAGAEALATEVDLERVDPDFFITEDRRRQLAQAKRTGRFHLDHGGADQDVYGTVGAVAVDRYGHVAAATSTGGMVNKRPGPDRGHSGDRRGDLRVGRHGRGERHRPRRAVPPPGGSPPASAPASSSSARIWPPPRAGSSTRICRRSRVWGGLIAVDRHGHVACPYNTAGMFRGIQVEGEPRIVAIW